MKDKKTGGLVGAAGFGNVAGPVDLTRMSNVKSNVKSNDDVNVKSEIKDTQSILKEVPDFNETPKKRPLTVYLDQEVWDALDQFAKPRGKGAKSDLLNKLLKSAFDVK